MSNLRPVSAVVIGTGMSGILAAIKLRAAGITDIHIFESADRVGGTWRANTYPGVACDVPSHAYTYSFELNPNWSSTFPKGAEIQRYFEHVFDKYRLAPITHFNESVTTARHEHGQWQVETARGRRLSVDLLFAATGILREPLRPDFPGMSSFGGAMFHTAEWNHDVELRGKRIGYIGTGATSAQAIPGLIDLPGTQVTVFQRTASWIQPVTNRPFSARERALFRRYPRLVKLVRDLSNWASSQFTAGLSDRHWTARAKISLLERSARRYLQTAIKDPVLRAKLTPNYRFGCKRMIINDTFYPAIQKPNAHLETAAIERFTHAGIVTADGKLHELDVVVLATGFNARAYLRPMQLVGRDGVSLNQTWEHKALAYRSTLLPGFPNFFLMLGPHCPIGNFSLIAISEAQMEYALHLIERWRRSEMHSIEPRPDALRRWNEMVRERFAGTAWTSGCNSWYLDADGDPMIWPDSFRKWYEALHEPRPEDFAGATA